MLSTLDVCVPAGKFDISGSGPTNVIGRSVSIHSVGVTAVGTT